MTLQTWIIEPRDSLIVRDGKPFGADITHATSLDFPFPSTTTGGVRTRAGLDANGKFDVSQISKVQNIEVKGAMLVGLNPDTNRIANFYLPSPADALLVQNEDQKLDGECSIKRLLPIAIDDAITNLPNNLMPVGITQNDSKVKPYTDLKFWNWSSLKDWLIDAKDVDNSKPNNYGINNLLKDSRTHVAINLDMASLDMASNDGDLFSTRGLEFNYGNGDLSNTEKLALVVFVDDANSKKLEGKGSLAPLGGERRLVTWREEKKQHQIQTCPDEIKERIKAEKSCRLMLLTPAYFPDGMPRSNDNYEVKAVACNRYQTVSGWDFEIDRPKPTRRLLPAGSVLFLDLQNNKDIGSWIDNTWFSCVGNNEQAIKDGFGLSVLGTWDENSLTEWR